MKTVYGKILKEGNMPKLAIADLLEISKKEYLITRLNVPPEHQKKGIGTELLTEITKDADKECSVLQIEPRPYGEITDEKTAKLIKFYEKFGFKFIAADVPMRRAPICKK